MAVTLELGALGVGCTKWALALLTGAEFCQGGQQGTERGERRAAATVTLLPPSPAPIASAPPPSRCPVRAPSAPRRALSLPAQSCGRAGPTRAQGPEMQPGAALSLRLWLYLGFLHGERPGHNPNPGIA